uniref:Uncharacterized protein n=1 Tax=Compsopogon caeruleus TaxID=31354 RepID=A0A7S1T7S0_9RHOD|mmetsp:Transcript_10711/g.21531  ORF Transcript_10711/g.21531 Transcript_10711/m.21531 type:complete len:131 (+) Transcript_10711:196-588(+)
MGLEGMEIGRGLWAVCANCGRCGALGDGELGGVEGGVDSEWFCGLNCLHSKALDEGNTRLRRKELKSVAIRRPRAVPEALPVYPVDGTMRSSYRMRLFNDDVEENSNALFVYHAYCCNAASFRPRNVWLQ